jgi:CrcB protein
VDTFEKYLVIAAGGALGAITRYFFNQLFAQIFAPFPFSTFFINLSGSFLIGLLFVLALERAMIGEYWRLALIVGFLGAYTTFSTFELETLLLVRERRFFIAAFYVLSSVFLGFLGVIGGIWLGRRF